MAQAPMFEQLRSMSDEELQIAYNAEARNTVLGLGFYREELWRRDVERAQQAATDAAETTKLLTWVILGLTLANVVLVAVQVVT